MAYCRRSEDSDVYMYATHNGTIECSGCGLQGVDGTVFIYRRDALAHLNLHLSWGHLVPQGATERLQSEVVSNGWMVTIGDDYEEEQEVLFFVAVEQINNNGTCLFELRAVCVDCPEIEFLPYVDEEFCYSLTRKKSALGAE